MTAVIDSQLVARIIREAAETEILPRFKNLQALQIREKKPNQLVTEADIEAEKVLSRRLRDVLPGAVVGEEGVESDPVLMTALERPGVVWVIDPVDGTANFARANPIFCACVSVLEGDTVTHAAVAAPRLGDLYHARLGGGAYRDSRGGRSPLRVSDTGKLEYAFFGADLAFRGSGASGPWQVLSASWQLRAIGSAGVRGAWLAAGYLDVSIGTRNTAWDYAPTVLLVSEAGGKATDLDGGPWTPASEGLVATNGRLHPEVLDILAVKG